MTFSFDPRKITRQEYHERIRALEARLDREQQACRKTEAELSWWTQGLELFAADEPGVASSAPTLPGTSTNGGSPAGRSSKPVLRDAILQIMGDGSKKRWKAPDLIRVLTERGWMPNGEHAEHIVRSRLSTLTKANELRRVSYGTYSLPRGDGP